MSKKNELAVPEKYKAIPSEMVIETVVDELEAFLVEGGKIVREKSLQVYFGTGQMLRDAEQKYKVNITALVERVVSDNRIRERQMGQRNTWFALKVFDFTKGKFDKLYETEFGENISVTKLKKLLTTPKPKVEKTAAELATQIVEKLGIEKSLELADAIWKEVKAVKKRLQDERAS